MPHVCLSCRFVENPKTIKAPSKCVDLTEADALIDSDGPQLAREQFIMVEEDFQGNGVGVTMTTREAFMMLFGEAPEELDTEHDAGNDMAVEGVDPAIMFNAQWDIDTWVQEPVEAMEVHQQGGPVGQVSLLAWLLDESGEISAPELLSVDCDAPTEVFTNGLSAEPVGSYQSAEQIDALLASMDAAGS